MCVFDACLERVREWGREIYRYNIDGKTNTTRDEERLRDHIKKINKICAWNLFDDWNVLKANKRLKMMIFIFLFWSATAEIEFRIFPRTFRHLKISKLIKKLKIIRNRNNLIQHKVHHLISGRRLWGYDHSEEIFKSSTRQRLIADH